MPRRRLRLTLALAALAIPLSGGLAVAAFSADAADPVSLARPAASARTPSSAPTASAEPRLGSAMYVTSAPPKPSPTPDNGIHVDCAKGADDNKGTLAKPLRSIRAATARALGPGTVIELARGCTWRTTVQLRGDGTAAEPIVLTAYGTGAQP